MVHWFSTLCSFPQPTCKDLYLYWQSHPLDYLVPFCFSVSWTVWISAHSGMSHSGTSISSQVTLIPGYFLSSRNLCQLCSTKKSLWTARKRNRASSSVIDCVLLLSRRANSHWAPCKMWYLLSRSITRSGNSSLVHSERSAHTLPIAALTCCWLTPPCLRLAKISWMASRSSHPSLRGHLESNSSLAVSSKLLQSFERSPGQRLEGGTVAINQQ